MNIQSVMKATVLGACCLFLTAVMASTPDGATPSEEFECDGLEGSEFAICNAYCEAMDCDSEDPKASNKACMKKSKKWQTLVGNQPFPCEAQPGILLTKSVNVDDFGEIMIGENVVYTFEIKNKGNIDLHNISLSDPQIVEALTNCQFELSGHILPVGSMVACSSDVGALSAANDTIDNKATVSATGIYGAQVSSSDTAQYTGTVQEAECPCIAFWAGGNTGDVNFPADYSVPLSCTNSPSAVEFRYVPGSAGISNHFVSVFQNDSPPEFSVICSVVIETNGLTLRLPGPVVVPDDVVKTLEACSSYIKEQVAPDDVCN